MASVNGSTASSASQDLIASLQRKKTSSVSETSTEGMSTNFLTLLTTQLKNQDPMNPLDNAQVTSQLAQINTVDGIQQLNTTLNALLSGQKESGASEAAALVGHGVLVPGKGLALSDAGSLGGFTLEEPADKVVLSIKDANGLEVASVDLGAFDAGTHNFQWDGTAADGSKAANGNYTVSLTATSGEDEVSAEALQLGAVSSVVRGPQSTDLQVGDLGIFKMSEVRQIF